MNNNNQDSIRMSLHQFFGGLISFCPDREAVVAVIQEELTKIARIDPEDNNSQFHSDLIKPILKSTVYIITIRYNKLFNDAISTFGEDRSYWPNAVILAIEKDKALIETLNKYIEEI